MQKSKVSVAIIFVNMILLGFLNSMRGVSFPLMKTGFNVSYDNMGLLNAMSSFSSVVFCVVSGIYMNRAGLKNNIITGFFILILGAGSLYFASGFWIAAGFFIVLQAGAGFFEIGLNGAGVRFFTVKSGLMLNLLHFFYGVGAIFGPRFMGLMVNKGLVWQEVYPLALIPALILLAVTLAIRFPERRIPGKTENTERQSFSVLLKEPMVWLFGAIIGIGGALEGCCVQWSGLYLYDVYGLDPSTTGAAFVSAFYALFTLSRFISGFIIEKTGYARSVLMSGFIIIVLFAAAFGLGRQGIYLLPVTGFFVAIMWPTVLAISAGFFGEKAQTASSAIICIAFSLSGIIHYGVGLINRFAGEAWGYRSCLLYAVILTALLLFLQRRIKAPAAGVK